jgi:hypothetical protein
MASWLFQPETESLKAMILKPAYVFSETGFSDEPAAQLEFACDDTSIHLLTQPSFSFNTPKPRYRKTATRRDFVGNTVTGILTIFTGLKSNKERVKEYSADFPFVSGSDSLHCIISYAEIESAERGRKKEKGTDGNT